MLPSFPVGPPVSAADVAAARRLRPWGELAVVGLAVVLAVGPALSAAIIRDVFREVIDLLRSDASTAEVDAALQEVAEEGDGRLGWVNLAGFLALVFLAGLAVWTNRMAGIAARLGHPHRLSTGWAAAGWFVPVVNLWFPYQAIVDCLSPTNPRRGRVLTWWLLLLAANVAGLAVFVVGVATDASVVTASVLPVLLAVPQAALGLRVIALVHEDHAAAVGDPAATGS